MLTESTTCEIATSREIRYFGPPGCGKTTTIKGLVIEKCKEYGSESILIACFTKTAAREVAGRHLPIDDQQIGTLHAHTFRALDRPKLVNKAALEEWNRQYPSRPFADGFKALDLDDPYKDQDPGQLQQGDTLLQSLNRYRGLLTPRETWPLSLQSFHEDWTAFKNSLDLLDFSDLIEICYFEKVPIPRGARVFFLDEVQDFSPLELALARQWGETCDEFYIAGDDDQCQPPGALVRTTTRGDVPISELQSTDLLRTFDRVGGSEFYGSKRRGYSFSRSERHYQGQIHTFITESGCALSTTHDHRMMVQWNRRAVGAVCVYVMVRGNAWRVGTTEVVRRRSGVFGPTQRARQEGAYAVWILDIFDTVSEARLTEDFIAARYGLSRLVFNAKYLPDLTHSQEALDHHHERMVFEGRIEQLFRDYGKDRELPYWTCEQGQSGRGCGALQVVRAVNCFPRYMQMLRDVGRAKGEKDVIAEIKKSFYSGPVFSLNVEPYHMYVSHSIAIPNCLYAFKGATPEAFLNPPLPPEQVRVLNQSYRVPRAVHALACGWVEQLSTRQPKLYRPRDFEGTVDRLPITYKYLASLHEPLRAWLKAGKTVALLASCSYMVDPVKHQLRAWGIPYHNPWRRTRGDWNPLLGKQDSVSAAQRVLSYLRPSRNDGWWTYKELWDWAGIIEADPIFTHGAKTAIRRKAEDELTGLLPVETCDLDAWIADAAAPQAAISGDLTWYQAHLLKSAQKPIAYACAIVESCGVEALTKVPQTIIGTIHSVKGGEADIVILFPDLSRAGFEEWCRPGPSRDSIVRMVYVGITRAKESLYLADPIGPIAVQISAGAA